MQLMRGGSNENLFYNYSLVNFLKQCLFVFLHIKKWSNGH